MDFHNSNYYPHLNKSIYFILILYIVYTSILKSFLIILSQNCTFVSCCQCLFMENQPLDNRMTVCYLYLYQQMFQKNTNFSIFGSCYQQTNNIKTPLQNAKSNSNLTLQPKQSKISLKKTTLHSARSNTTCRLMKDITAQVTQHRNKNNEKLKWMPFQSTKLLLNQPSYQKLQPPSHQRKISLIKQHPSVAKIINFKYSNQSKEDLQQTVKFTSTRGQRIKSHNIQNVNNKQMTVLNKKTFISNLISYRTSLVSINLQNDNPCPKMQESSIMMDFFNPTDSKVSQIHNYLSLQR